MQIKTTPNSFSRYSSSDIEEILIKQNHNCKISLLLLFMYGFLFLGSFNLSNAQQQSQSQQSQSTLIPAISGIVGAIIGSISTVYFGPVFTEKFKLREEYVVPFRRWCIEFYGELREFEKYVEKDLSIYSDHVLILDLEGLHAALIKAYRWIGMIEKEDEAIGEKIIKLMNTVENFWHYLDNDYNKELDDVEKYKQFNTAVKKLDPSIRGEIANKIRHHLEENRDVYNKKDFLRFYEYFFKKVPGRKKGKRKNVFRFKSSQL